MQTKCYHSAHVFHCINVQREQIGTCTCWLHIIKSVSKASQWINSLTLFPNLMDPCPIVHAHCNMEGSQGNEGGFYCHIQLQGWFLGQEGGDCRQLRTYNVLFQGPLSVTLLYCKKQKATCTVSRVWKQCCTMYTYYYMYVALLPPFFLNLEVRLKGAFTWNIKFTRQYIYCHLTCPCLPTMDC